MYSLYIKLHIFLQLHRNLSRWFAIIYLIYYWLLLFLLLKTMNILYLSLSIYVNHTWQSDLTFTLQILYTMDIDHLLITYIKKFPILFFKWITQDFLAFCHQTYEYFSFVAHVLWIYAKTDHLYPYTINGLT